jgi:PBSX family phage terminase large subunit
MNLLPPSVKQQWLLRWWRPDSPFRNKDTIIAEGAIRTGKSLFLILGYVMWSLEMFSGDSFIVAAQSVKSIKKNLLGYFYWAFEELGVPFRHNRSENTIYAGGNEYIFYGAPHEAAQDGLQGLTAAGALIDEGVLIPKSFFDQANGRMSVEGAKLWINCNPGHPRHYLKTDVIDRDEYNALIVHFKLDDNPGLSQKVKDRLSRKNQPSSAWYKRNIGGEWAVAEGLVYSMFSEDIHVVDITNVLLARKARPFRHYIVGCDYGAANDALVYTLWGFDEVDTNSKRGFAAYLLKEYYYAPDLENGRPPKANHQMADDMVAFLGGIRPERIYVDSGGGGASLITDLRQRGLPAVAATKGPGSVEDGLGVVGDLLARNLVFVDKSCVHTIEEFLGYEWDDKALKNKPKDGNDHCMDAVRYALYSHFGNKKIAPRYVGASG